MVKQLKQLGLRMPAEWEPHSAVWLTWPHDEISFPGRIENVENEVVRIIAAIHDSEQVELLVLDENMKAKAAVMLKAANVNLAQVTFRLVNYMDGWMRDCGGIFVKDPAGKVKLINWIFNCWGNKFPDLQIDADIPKKVAEWTGLERLDPGIILEGGAIDVNGQGILLTTEQCMLKPNRNPNLTKAEIEKYLQDFLGVTKIVWLKKGLFNDHTDGHIDDIARFVASNKIVIAYEDDPKDENYQTLKENFEALSKELFEIIKLPMPHMYYDKDKPFEAGQKAPASYTNFYIGNKVVLAPIFNDPNDVKALEILQSVFPDRRVVGIDCRDLIYGGGAIHCMTQQQPAVS